MRTASPRVLLLGLNYPPEPTGISPYTGAMARGLVRRGFITRVLTTHPHYPAWRIQPGYGQWESTQTVHGVLVTRLLHYVPSRPAGLKRAASEASFGARLVGARWGRPDAIVLVSPALISSAAAALRRLLSLRQPPLVVWVQDLYTLGLSETGQGQGAVVRAMAVIEGWLLRRADRVVVIHERFRTRVSEDFDIPLDKIEVVRNWTHLGQSDPVDIDATRARFGWSSNETVVLHAGNMGVKQGLHNVVEAARLAEESGSRVRFVLIGGGSQLESLQAAGAGLSHLSFMASLDDADFAAALRSADCLLVNELPGVSEMAVPSKLTSYFSASRPVIASTDPDGITAEEIQRAGAGVVVSSGDPKALLAAAEDLASDPDRSTAMGAAGLRYRETVLDEASAIEHFSRILTDLISPDGALALVDQPTDQRTVL
ncbi:glycosyltransferase family 4 protein [Microbacterium sp. W1N]|uniref:glycosyltransferase family 4 protein n=1 Tax=Microbacterium festucae TaxID=2977531 RepID=UPI0021BE1513|nr:glycosyltransferase family 4 protein [Microbacterium festucae]MCT9819036.1 glycosyltransferase family 4 protein [Microbacterium festucae]